MSLINNLVVVGILTVATGAAMMTISLSTTHWMESESQREEFGLFKGCIKGTCGDLVLSSEAPVGGKMKTAKVLASFGEVCAIIVIITGSVFAHKARRGFVKRPLLYATFALSLLAAVLVSTTCIIYKKDIYDELVEPSVDSDADRVNLANVMAGLPADVQSAIKAGDMTFELYTDPPLPYADLQVGYSLYLAAVGAGWVFLGGILTLTAGLKVKQEEGQGQGHGQAVGYNAGQDKAQAYVQRTMN